MPIFKRGRGPFALHQSMVGVKMGDRFLQLGCGDGRLFATLAAKVGLTGRACAVDASDRGAAAARHAATTEGVLVEVDVARLDQAPYEDASFDIILLHRVISTMIPEARVACLQKSLRLLRPGGRCIVTETTPRGGLAGLLSRQPTNSSYVTTGGAERALSEEGFTAVRKLAEREGEAFYEAVRPRG